MGTERQIRESEQLITFEDYLQLISQLDEVAGDTANGENIDKAVAKSLKCVSNGMYQKVRYIVRSSKKWRKKQGLASRIRDKKEEEKENVVDALIEENYELKQRLESLQNTLQLEAPDKATSLSAKPPKRSLWGKFKALFHRNKAVQSLPRSESVTDLKKEDAEPEIVEEDQTLDNEEYEIEDEVEDEVFEF